ncbi:MAG: DUF4838 domain-containing protein [Oscillospiraceae bacterium]|nr:DUF4838 domain-containing protein [Oscillospiraceae bacterium]
MYFKIAKISYDPVIGYAAGELKRCLSEMDPTLDIMVLTYPAYRADLKDALWIGMDEAFPLPPVADTALDDAIAIDVDKGCGYITGANPRAVLIAAFRYLRELGAMWVRPTEGEILPQCDVRTRSVKLSEIPANRHRGVCIEGAVSPDHVAQMIDWLPRVGMNAYFNQFWIPAVFYERWFERQRNPLLTPYPIDLADAEGMRDSSVYEIKRRGLLYHGTGHGWTCEPFGISGTGWQVDRVHHVPEEAKQYLAEVNGKRDLWGNVPLNTNLCYSNPVVRSTMASSVADYCETHPEVDYLHVWLADGKNNHCECAACQKKRPSDWYIDILNEIDEKMTAKALKTKVVFLLYCDLYWEPVESKLNNPDRFVLMFAPITRTYTHSLGEAGDYDAADLSPYVRNNCVLPSSVEENLCRLRQWQKFFSGDCFDFDYHYMWDHHRDVAQMHMNRVLFDDMKAMSKLHMTGMMSCQNQRVWMPTGFGMAAMAEALWNADADFDTVADNYFFAAFGPDGSLVRDYLQKLSDAFVPPYFRSELPAVCPEAAASMENVTEITAEFQNIILKNLDASLPDNQLRSWEYLDYHRQLCDLLAPSFQKMAEGDLDEAARLFRRFCRWLQENETAVSDVLDVFELQSTLARSFKALGAKL